MSRFHITPRAARDLDAIANWTLRQWGADRMEQYLNSLNDRFQWLAFHPAAGRMRNDVAEGYRSFPEGQPYPQLDFQPFPIIFIVNMQLKR